MEYATLLQDQPMLTKIIAVDLTSRDAKYHGVCRVKYQTEAESKLEEQKASLNVTFTHSHSLWHKERKAHVEAHVEAHAEAHVEGHVEASNALKI